MHVLGLALGFAVSAWGQANVYQANAILGFEDLTTEAESDRDYNDVAVRGHRKCRLDTGGLLVGEVTTLAGVSAGASKTNAVWMTLEGTPTSLSVQRGTGAPEAGFVESGRVRLWSDFRDAFGGASGLLNTGNGAIVPSEPLTVEVTWSPGVDTDGRCPPIDLVVVRASEGIVIDRTSTLPPNGQPLSGEFPDRWSVPGERIGIEQAYPEFLPWLAEQAGSCGTGCVNEDWFYHPSLPDVIVRADLDATAPLPPPATCSDGAQNQDEEGVDCGGDVCGPCPSAWRDHCLDRVQNADETGVDCGGARCLECVTDCDGDPVGNPDLEILRFEGVVESLYFDTLPGPGIGDPLTGWVAWDTGYAVDQFPEFPETGLYCYDDIPGQFQMVIRSGSDCWETIDWPYPIGDAFTCQRVDDDSPAFGPPRDYLEFYSWEFGRSDAGEYGLGSIWLSTTDRLDTFGDSGPKTNLPPLSTFYAEAVIYLEIGDLDDNYRGAWAPIDTLRGRMVEPEYGTVYYTGFAQDLVPFGSMDWDGTLAPIGTGLPVPGETNPTLVLVPAPDGTLYAFNTGRLSAGSPSSQAPYSSWGRVDLTTGAFTTIGDLGQVFKIPAAFGGIKEPQFVFDGPGRLLAFGLDKDYNARFVELDLTTGDYTDLVTGLGSQVSAVAEAPDGTLYYAQSAGGTAPVPFGTVQADGTMTPIGTGLVLSPSEASNSSTRLLFAPDGTLYGFNTGGLRTGSPGASANPSSWGRIDPSTGSFTVLGNLADFFKVPSSGGIKEPVFWFDGRGRLFAAGLTPAYETRLVKLDRETGEATVILTVGSSQTKVAVTPGAPTGEEAACWSAGATWRYPGCDCPSGVWSYGWGNDGCNLE